MARTGLGFEDKDVEFPFRHVEFELIGCQLKGGFLVGHWIRGSVAHKELKMDAVSFYWTSSMKTFKCQENIRVDHLSVKSTLDPLFAKSGP